MGLLYVAGFVVLPYAFHIDASPLLVALGAMALLWLSIRYKYLALLQLFLGFAAILAAARWSRGATFGWPLFSSREPVDLLAGPVCLVLLLAALQASRLASCAESATRRCWRRLWR